MSGFESPSQDKRDVNRVSMQPVAPEREPQISGKWPQAWSLLAVIVFSGLSWIAMVALIGALR